MELIEGKCLRGIFDAQAWRLRLRTSLLPRAKSSAICPVAFYLSDLPLHPNYKDLTELRRKGQANTPRTQIPIHLLVRIISARKIIRYASNSPVCVDESVRGVYCRSRKGRKILGQLNWG